MTFYAEPQASQEPPRDIIAQTTSCKRAACANPSPTKQCCDSNCLVVIARRDCSRNPNKNHNDAKNKHRSLDDGSRGRAVDEPCEDHYQKAKLAYGAILDNLGCICKILLSLNLESCCSTPTGSLRSKRSTSSTKSLLKNTRTDLDRKTGDISVDNGAEDCCSNNCESVKTGLATEDSICENSEEHGIADLNKGVAGFGTTEPTLFSTEESTHENRKRPRVEDTNDEGNSLGTSDKLVPLLIPKDKAQASDISKDLSMNNVVQQSENYGKKCCGGDTKLPGKKIPSLNADGDSIEYAKNIPGPSVAQSDCCEVVNNFQITEGRNSECCTARHSRDTTPKCYENSFDQGSKGDSCGNVVQDAKYITPALQQPINTSGKSADCCQAKSVQAPKTSDECSMGCCDDIQNVSIPVSLPTESTGPNSDCCQAKSVRTSSNSDDCSKGCCEDDQNDSISCSNLAKSKPVQRSRCPEKTAIAATVGEDVIQALEIPECAEKPFISQYGGNHVDLEKGGDQVEHLLLSVQGMTCTGCEKKLFKALQSLPSISNIKASVLLSQAEFDIHVSTSSGGSSDIIETIEKMTGFTCSKMTQTGQEIDLVIDNSAANYEPEDAPLGVSNITLLDKKTIRVVYQPRIIGARELMAHPFFRHSKLAPIAPRPIVASGRAHIREMLFKTILSAILTIPVLVMAWAPLPDHEVAYGATSLALATIIQVYIAGPFYAAALKTLVFSRMIEMDLLIVISTTIAYVYSIAAYAFVVTGKPLPTKSFFETSTLLVTLIMLGRLVSAFARQQAMESISIESLQPSTALLIDPKTKNEEEIDSRLLEYQDEFKVLSGSSIATDGTVISGVSEVDESMITGEAVLVGKRPGSIVVAGSINHSGILTVRLSRLAAENTIRSIGLMVDEAKSSKTDIQEIADRVASYFVPLILGITFLIFVIWVAIGKLVQGHGTTTACINAMTYSISALIVSCPCAIGLAVPMVLAIAGGVAAKHGVIFKTANTIEVARKVTHLVLDKTGTLTEGSMAVEVEMYPSTRISKETIAPIILSLTKSSNHPISTAIASWLDLAGVNGSEKIEKINSIPGYGIEATWRGFSLRAGNPYWLGVERTQDVENLLQLGMSIFCLTVDGDLAAIFGLKDHIRPDIKPIIDQLIFYGLEVSILSGDTAESVKHVAQYLGIPQSHIRSRCSPADKQQYVRKALTVPKAIVMFCGDGTNDAAALAEASIGVHMNGGTEIAQSAADAVLIRPTLRGILVLIELSNAFFRRVVFNFIWSFVYNTFAILLAAGAFPNARISPQYAGLGEIVSVLPVIMVGVQLRWVKFTKTGLV